MTYIVELKPEVSRNIEAQAAQKGVKPEEFLGELAESFTEAKEARRAEVCAMAEKLFGDRAGL